MGIPYKIILLRCTRSHAYGLPMGSLCALGHRYKQLARVPYGIYNCSIGLCGCQTGFEHPYAKPVEKALAEPVRISKPRKESIKGCTIISKAHQGSLWALIWPVRAPTTVLGSPYLKGEDAKLSATGYTKPWWVQTYFKNCSGPYSMPCGCPRVLCPYRTHKTARELNVSGALIINVRKWYKVVNYGPLYARALDDGFVL